MLLRRSSSGRSQRSAIRTRTAEFAHIPPDLCNTLLNDDPELRGVIDRAGGSVGRSAVWARLPNSCRLRDHLERCAYSRTELASSLIAQTLSYYRVIERLLGGHTAPGQRIASETNFQPATQSTRKKRQQIRAHPRDRSLVNVRPLFVSNPQPPELIQPSKSPFDHPSPSPQPATMFGVALRKKRDDVADAQTSPD